MHQYWSSISASRKKLKIISYFQWFLHNFFTFYPKNPKRPNRQSANMAHFVAFCIGFLYTLAKSPWGRGGIWQLKVYIYYSKKFRIIYYILFEHTILNSRSYSWREGNFMKFIKQYQWACESTSTNFQDDLTVILENPKIRVFPKIFRKVILFISYLQTCYIIITWQTRLKTCITWILLS